MKKLFSVLLAICMLLSMLALVSCKKQTLSERVNEAISATYSTDSYAANYEMKISMETMGMTLDIPTTMDMKVKNATSASPIASIDLTMEMFGSELEMAIYMEDGWVYASAFGASYKARVTENEDLAEYTQTADNILKVLPANYFEGVEATKNPDGSETVVICMPGDAFSEIFSDTVAGAAASAADSIEDVEVSNTRLEITIKDGMVSVYSMAFDMSMKSGGIDVVATVSADMTFTAFGDAVVITPPEGYLDYPEQ